MAKKGIIKRYVDAKGKKKFGTSAMKMGVETGSALVGCGAAAASGVASPFLGIGLLFLGQIIGDETGLIKVAGAGMIGYGIANSFVHREDAKSASVNGLGAVSGNVKQRMIDYKDNLMHAFYLDKVFKKDEGASKDDLGSAPYLDTSGLDVFADFNQQLAIRQAEDEVTQEPGIYYEPSTSSYEDDLVEEMDDLHLM